MADGQIIQGVRWLRDAAGRLVGYRNPVTDKDEDLNVASLQSLVSDAGDWASLTPTARQTGIELFGPTSANTMTPSAAAGATIQSSGVVTINGEPYYNIQATGISASNNWIELSVTGLSPYLADHCTLEFRGDMTVGAIVTPYMGTAAYAQFVTANFVEQAPTGRSEMFNAGLRSHNVREDLWTKNGFSGAFATTLIREMDWRVAKIRVTIPNGGTINLNFRSMRVGCRRGVGRICFVADDGYDSVHRLALPLFESFGIPLTGCIIPPKVGTAGYMTEAQLRDMVNRGHALVPHGPLQNNTNLFDAPYTTTAQRVADAQASAQWLLDRGLCTPRQARCYIWPEGRYAVAGSGSTELIEALQAVGFTHGRSIAVAGPANSVYANSLSDQCNTRMLWPILGHTYAGATNTADDAAETTNITTIAGRITALGTYGQDGHVMLHKFVARGAAAAGGIDIEVDRLRTLLAAAAAEIQAGRLVAVKMDALAY